MKNSPGEILNNHHSPNPLRIVSLVPSITELLYHLGLDDAVVGITKFCIKPTQWFKSKSRIGGTKTVDIHKVKQLQPTLILANKEENVKEQVEALQQISRVYVSDVSDLSQALKMIDTIGKLTSAREKAQEIVQKIESDFLFLKNNIATPTARAAYLIWRDPYMVAGGDTFITDMMLYCGLQNVFADATRYPSITVEDIAARKCDVVLLSSEPFPFGQQHADELHASLPGVKIMLVDGEMFSWYGSRLVYAPQYFKQLSVLIAPAFKPMV